MDEFDSLDIYSDALDEIFSNGGLSKGQKNLYKIAFVEETEALEAPRYAIFNVLEKPFICDICDGNAWTYLRGDHEKDEPEFCCDHSSEFPYYMTGMFVGRIIKERDVEYVEPA